MFKKIIVAVLAVSVLGAAGAALAYTMNAAEVEIQAAEVSPIIGQQTNSSGCGSKHQSKPRH